MFYDDTFKDEYSHEHVRLARETGRAWAEREWADWSESTQGSGSSWPYQAEDAIARIRFDPDDETEDQSEREAELAEVCGRAAKERWDELMTAFEADNRAAKERWDEMLAAIEAGQ